MYPRLAAWTVLVCSLSTTAQVAEIEPNEQKNVATLATLGPGAGQTSLTGTTTGTSFAAGTANSLDCWLVTTAPLPAGIYRHQLVLGSTTQGHTATLRGLNQSAGVIGSSDVTIQNSLVLPSGDRLNQWYGFGGGESLYYRVQGLATTTAPYTATLATSVVAPLCGGVHQPGQITISTVAQGHGTNTDLWVYDSSFTAIGTFGNDDEPAPGASFQSSLTRTFTPGIYYIALAPTPFANNQASPIDDRNQSSSVMDLPGTVVSGASGTNLDVSFAITDSAGTIQIPATKSAAFDVVWVRFVVATTSLPPPFQVNQAESTFDINGVVGDVLRPADIKTCVNTPVNVTFASSLVSNGWDLAVSPSPAVAAPSDCGPGNGGFVTVTGQRVNINVAAPGLFFFNGLLFPPFFGNATVPVTGSAPVPVLTAQMLVLDASIADGYRLSAPSQLHLEPLNTSALPIVGPSVDDTSITVDVGCLTFFNVVHTRIYPTSNGRVNFVAANSASTASVATALTNNPWVGCWADIDPAAGGTWGVTSPSPGIFRVDYNNVRYWSSTLPTQIASFGIQFDTNTNIISLDGLTGITDPSPLAVVMVMGLSIGTPLVSNAGAATFAVGGPNIPGAATDMLYMSGQPGTFATGVNRIDFIPNNGGPTGSHYAWIGF